MVKTETVRVRWAADTDAGHKDPTVQLSGAEGDWGIRQLKLSPSKLDYPITLPGRDPDGRHIHLHPDLASDN